MIQHKTVSFGYKDLEMVLEATIDTKKNSSGLSFKIKPITPKQGRKPSEFFSIDGEDAIALMEWLRDEVLGLKGPDRVVVGPDASQVTSESFKDVPVVKEAGLTSAQVRARRAKKMGIVDMSNRLTNPQAVKVSMGKKPEGE